LHLRHPSLVLLSVRNQGRKFGCRTEKAEQEGRKERRQEKYKEGKLFGGPLSLSKCQD
jgi:hypothetical protein